MSKYSIITLSQSTGKLFLTFNAVGRAEPQLNWFNTPDKYMEGFFKGYKMQNRVVVSNKKHTKTWFKKRRFLNTSRYWNEKAEGNPCLEVPLGWIVQLGGNLYPDEAF